MTWTSSTRVRRSPSPWTTQAKALHEEQIIPFWQGKSMRDLILSEMTDEWKAAYEAGIFTEFMEQRSPGHTVLDDKIYRKGMLDFKADIQRSLDSLDFLERPGGLRQTGRAEGHGHLADALIRFARTPCAEGRTELAAAGDGPAAQGRTGSSIAEICRHVPAHAPRDFPGGAAVLLVRPPGRDHRAEPVGCLQSRDDWINTCIPSTSRDLADGTLTREQAEELLHCFWIKFNNQPAPPKVGVTAAESGTYTDFAQINTGGVKADGSDAVNEVTYLLLDVIEEMRLLQPSSSVQLSKKNPDRFIKRAAKIIRTGFGQPSIFNTDVVVQEMIRPAKSLRMRATAAPAAAWRPARSARRTTT